MQTIPGPLVYAALSSTANREMFLGLPVGIELFLNYSLFFDDFNGVTVDATNDWTVIVDTGCTAAILADTENGICQLLSDSTTDEGASIQGNEIFKFNSGKKFLFESRVCVADADDVDFFIGLAENFATNPEALLAGSLAGFHVTEAGATGSILCKAGAAGAASEDSGSDLADATYAVLGMLYDGTDLHYYVNREKKVTIAAASLPSALMTPASFFLAGDNAADYANIDYIFIASER